MTIVRTNIELKEDERSKSSEEKIIYIIGIKSKNQKEEIDNIEGVFTN